MGNLAIARFSIFLFFLLNFLKTRPIEFLKETILFIKSIVSFYQKYLVSCLKLKILLKNRYFLFLKQLLLMLLLIFMVKKLILCSFFYLKLVFNLLFYLNIHFFLTKIEQKTRIMHLFFSGCLRNIRSTIVFFSNKNVFFTIEAIDFEDQKIALTVLIY